MCFYHFFFFQAEDGIRDHCVTGVQTCALPISALRWITDFGDRDGDGYVEYQRTTDHGLQNQGWKDSWDSMRFADGALARSEERRVGKECRSGWARDREKKKMRAHVGW